jgi:hypothetical protein
MLHPDASSGHNKKGTTELFRRDAGILRLDRVQC